MMKCPICKHPMTQPWGQSWYCPNDDEHEAAKKAKTNIVNDIDTPNQDEYIVYVGQEVRAKKNVLPLIKRGRHFRVTSIQKQIYELTDTKTRDFFQIDCYKDRFIDLFEVIPDHLQTKPIPMPGYIVEAIKEDKASYLSIGDTFKIKDTRSGQKEEEYVLVGCKPNSPSRNHFIIGKNQFATYFKIILPKP